MPTANRAFTRYTNRFQRHQAHAELALLVRTYGAFTMSQDELFPDIQRAPKRDKTPESGFLDFPATYDPTPVPITDYAAMIDATYGQRPAEKCRCGAETDLYTAERPMCADCIEKAEPCGNSYVMIADDPAAQRFVPDEDDNRSWNTTREG